VTIVAVVIIPIRIVITTVIVVIANLIIIVVMIHVVIIHAVQNKEKSMNARKEKKDVYMVAVVNFF